MAKKKDNTTSIGFEETIWRAADKLRGNLNAAEYDIDWNRKESARVKMRVLVKRLLKKYKYPPEGQEQALQVVMEQCNKWADDEDNVIEMNTAYSPYEDNIRMAAEPIE